MHAFLLTDEERLATLARLLARVAGDDRVWSAPLADVAAFVAADTARFEGRAELERNSWL